MDNADFTVATASGLGAISNGATAESNPLLPSATIGVNPVCANVPGGLDTFDTAVAGNQVIITNCPSLDADGGRRGSVVPGTPAF